MDGADSINVIAQITYDNFHSDDSSFRLTPEIVSCFRLKFQKTKK